MSIKSDLKKDGIEVIRQLDTLTVNSIAKNVSYKICNSFPNYNLNPNSLFIKLSRLNMYMAKMPNGMAEANYFYKNTSIYFNDKIDMNDIEEFSIHECIHYIQEIKDKRNFLIRMGLCDYTDFKIYGLGLNEAAVQLMSSKIIGIPKDYVKYFGISFETISPSYYPLECCLVNQLAYITGEDVLFESTINSNNNFKDTFSNLTSPQTFMTIQNAIDDILYKEEDIIKLNNKIIDPNTNSKNIDNYQKKIDELKNEITLTFMRTQNLIISSYFDNEFNRISNLEEVENYRRNLYNFKSYLGITDGYTFFDEYYVNKMENLEELYLSIENGTFKKPSIPAVVKNNRFVEILNRIKNFFNKLINAKEKKIQNS